MDKTIFIIIGLAVMLIFTIGSNDIYVNTNPTDGVTGALETVDYAHHEIHEGSSYVVSGQRNLGSGASEVHVFNTSGMNGKWSHIIFSVRSSAEANLMLYENVTWSDGSIENVSNRNLNYNSNNLMGVIHSPNLLTFETEIFQEHFGAGKNIGGENRNSYEFVLAENQTYALEINSEAAANDVSWIINWYESTPKNLN